MKKRGLLLMTIVFIIALLSTTFICWEKSPVVVMKIGHSQPTDHPRHLSFLKFQEIVGKRTDGAIKVEIYPAGQLGTEAEQMEAVKMGVLNATRGGSFEAATPRLLIYTMPFLFKDLDSVHKITRGPWGEKIAEAAKENNIIILATGDAGGMRNITNNVRQIKKPQDMKGLKLRTPPIESIIKIMEALGANPVSIPYSEVYLALKTNVADGQENPYVNITAMKFYEVQKYLTVLNYQYHPDPFFVNLNWYNSLSPQMQGIIKEASVEMMIYNDELIKEETDNSYKILQKNMDVYVLSTKEREAFIKQVQSVYDYYIKKGLFTRAEIDEIRKIAN